MSEIITELDAKEAAMNGATVRYRRYPPYLRCLLCGGDGSSLHPYLMGCGPHDPGWEIVGRRPNPMPSCPPPGFAIPESGGSS